LIGLANTTDGSGEYLFAGFRSGTKPFAETAPGVVAYFGDEGRQEVAVSTSRAIAVNDSGADILQRIKNGNGTFVTAAGGGNAGTGVISPGSVIDSTALTGRDYAINFTVTGDVTTYDIVDTTSATTIATGVPFVSEGPITVAGMQFAIEGAPANGDQFTVQPSASVSVFSTLASLRTALRSAAEGDVANASLTNALNAANSNLTNALDRVLAVTASVGTRMRETDAVLTTNEDLDLNYQARLSDLGDLDYARAISDLNFQQMHLEAAQKSFMLISGLSLFKML
jgi:flagellar hook-associated protein 3 FlgL